MADEKLQTPAAPSPAPSPQEEEVLKSNEVDSAKWTLPPFGVVGIVLLIIFVIVGAISWINRPKPKALGTLDEIYAVVLPDNSSVLVTAKLTLNNVGGKPLWIRNIKAQLKTDQGEFNDDAASAIDFDRYFRGYPDLRDHSINPLKVETKIPPGSQERGSVIVSFPVPMESFDKRTSLSFIIEPYDQNPLIITK